MNNFTRILEGMLDNAILINKLEFDSKGFITTNYGVLALLSESKDFVKTFNPQDVFNKNVTKFGTYKGNDIYCDKENSYSPAIAVKSSITKSVVSKEYILSYREIDLDAITKKTQDKKNQEYESKISIALDKAIELAKKLSEKYPTYVCTNCRIVADLINSQDFKAKTGFSTSKAEWPYIYDIGTFKSTPIYQDSNLEWNHDYIYVVDRVDTDYNTILASVRVSDLETETYGYLETVTQGCDKQVKKESEKCDYEEQEILFKKIQYAAELVDAAINEKADAEYDSDVRKGYIVVGPQVAAHLAMSEYFEAAKEKVVLKGFELIQFIGTYKGEDIWRDAYLKWDTMDVFITECVANRAYKVLKKLSGKVK